MKKLTEVRSNGVLTGYTFLCPGCKRPHYCTIKPHSNQLGASWDFNGDIENPTFSPSVLQKIEWTNRPERPVEICHSFVRNGKIEFLGDCTHELAGKTVEMLDANIESFGKE